MHYGIKGMRWGVRKDRQTSDKSTGEKKRGLSRGQKIALGVAAVAVAGTVLYKTGNFDKVAAAGKRAITRSKARKLGLELVQNPSEKSTSNFDRAMSRMNDAFKSGRLSVKYNMARPMVSSSSKSSPTKTLGDFAFERLQRVDANGNVSTIDLPKDRKGYADTFAKSMSKKSGDYDYWHKYIMGRMNAQSGSMSYKNLTYADLEKLDLF